MNRDVIAQLGRNAGLRFAAVPNGNGHVKSAAARLGWDAGLHFAALHSDGLTKEAVSFQTLRNLWGGIRGVFGGLRNQGVRQGVRNIGTNFGLGRTAAMEAAAARAAAPAAAAAAPSAAATAASTLGPRAATVPAATDPGMGMGALYGGVRTPVTPASLGTAAGGGGGGGGIMSGGTGPFWSGGGGGAAAPAAAAAAGGGGGGRSHWLRNTLLGGAGATAVGLPYARELSQSAYYNPEASVLNPFTWGALGGSRATPEQAWSRNTQRLAGLTADTRQQIIAALGKGDHAKARRLMNDLQTGNFSGGSPLFSPSAAYHTRVAGEIQRGAQTEYDKLMGQGAGGQAGDIAALSELEQMMRNPALLPEHRRLAQQQMNMLYDRLNRPTGEETPDALARRLRAEGVGMHINRPVQNLATSSNIYSGWRPGAMRAGSPIPVPQGINFNYLARDPLAYGGLP